jgi:hypothetical protein
VYPASGTVIREVKWRNWSTPHIKMFFAKKAAGKYPLNPELMKLKTKLSPPDAKWLNVSFTQSSVDIALKEIDEYLKKLDKIKLGDQSPYHMPESQVQKKGKKVIRKLLPPPVVK